ncbi:MAG: class I SAM-dependent methyltransferase [Leptospiraceae bacterium]|nr:class I SAM-dependent methyltransferase [Leptospiraceae bacterium]
MSNNIQYNSSLLSNYFQTFRVKWDQFYPSEQKIITDLDPNKDSKILDIGCGCGGLGLALSGKFGVKDYTGIDINEDAIQKGKELSPQSKLISGDILQISEDKIGSEKFDIVFSLSCVDWNLEFKKMLDASWNYVKEGGYLVSTFRLTTGESLFKLEDSFQYINFDGKLEGEKAAYVVLNFSELCNLLFEYSPEEVNAYGYWGKPSSTAVMKYSSLCFAAFAIKKQKSLNKNNLNLNLDLPLELIHSLVKN